MKTLQQAAQDLLGFVLQRQNAFKAAQAKGFIMGNHPGFAYCAELIPFLSKAAKGETQRWHIAHIIKHTSALYFICTRKEGENKRKQLAKINASIDVMRAFLHKKAA